MSTHSDHQSPHEDDGRSGISGPLYGVYPARVVDYRDPDEIGRVKVSLPWAMDSNGVTYAAWARLATLMAGREKGTWFRPDVDDEVLVAFEAGDPRRPYVVGALWNGKDRPPAPADASQTNDVKLVRSRSGITILLDDTPGRERLVLETREGQRLTMKDAPGAIDIVDSNGNAIRCEPAGITVTATAKVSVSASTLAISAGIVTIDAGMVRCSGIVQTDTLIANSVVSASYTPGAGNIW